MGEEVDFPEFLPAVQSVLSEYKRRRRLSELARGLGFSKNRLTEIMYGKRKLTAYYLAKLIEANVMNVDKQFGDTLLDKLPEGKRILAKRLFIDPRVVDVLDREMQILLKQAIEQNRLDDLRTILKTVLKK